MIGERKSFSTKMPIHKPTDRCRTVWLIFFVLGIATLLPWNFFITATAYFSSRLATDQPANTTAEERRSYLQAKLNNVMTLCAMVPLLIFTFLTSILHQRVPERCRITGSLLFILLMFFLTAILVKVPMWPLIFFVITMIITIIINAFGAILQGSLFGMASVLPTGYTTPILSGQGVAGTFAAVAMICTLSSGSLVTETALGYFLTACIIMSVTILFYFALSKLWFYQKKNQSKEDEENETQLEDTAGEETHQGANIDTIAVSVQHKSSIWAVFKKIWMMALTACLGFSLTLSVFPAVAVDVKSTVFNGGEWEKYFIPVGGFLVFNVCDLAGRVLTAVVKWPASDSKLLPLLMLSRVIFVALLMFCNVQPRHTLPVIFRHDIWFIFFIFLLGLSNGYLGSLCMCYGSKKVEVNEAQTAGTIMAFFMTSGLVFGAGISFLFRETI